jgi:putative PIN family toxin of toxin-antitoxin system
MGKRAVRVFLDSNVILSGLISDKGAPRIILDILSLKLPFITGITGRYNILEIERNLKKKVPGIFPVYKQYLSRMNLKIVSLPSAEEVKRFAGHLSDKDVPVLVSAIHGTADFLVTGDKKDFEKLKVRGGYPCVIVSPSEFLETILPAMIKGDKEQG